MRSIPIKTRKTIFYENASAYQKAKSGTGSQHGFDRHDKLIAALPTQYWEFQVETSA